jgi:hypothetical protein
VLLERRKHELTLSSFVALHANATTCTTATSHELTYQLGVSILLVDVRAKTQIVIHCGREAMALGEHSTPADWRSTSGFQPRRWTLSTTRKEMVPKSVLCS